MGYFSNGVPEWLKISALVMSLLIVVPFGTILILKYIDFLAYLLGLVQP